MMFSQSPELSNILLIQRFSSGTGKERERGKKEARVGEEGICSEGDSVDGEDVRYGVGGAD